jgi:hypothetical protein
VLLAVTTRLFEHNGYFFSEAKTEHMILTRVTPLYEVIHLNLEGSTRTVLAFSSGKWGKISFCCESGS